MLISRYGYFFHDIKFQLVHIVSCTLVKIHENYVHINKCISHKCMDVFSGGISVRVSVGNLHVIHLPQIVIQDLVSGVNYWDVSICFIYSV